MSDAFKFVQVQPYSLAGAGAVAGDTTIILKSFEDIDGNVLAMSDFGDVGFGTLEPGNGSQEEQISFTGVTQNASGTATLTGVSNVSFLYPYTETSGLSKAHPGSSIFVISNTSGFYDKLTSKSDDETITGVWTFDSVPNTTQDPVSGNDIARRSWVLSVVNGGTVSTNSIVVSGTAGETITAGNLIYFKSADQRWWKTDADDSTTVQNVFLGIAQGSGTAGVSISSGILIEGVDTHQSAMTPGSTYYASNTAGAISSSAGTFPQTVGAAVSATQIYFNPVINQYLTGNQKNAAAGNSGTPSSSNLFITELGLGRGGTGADGALSISSGTTTIDLASAAVVVKNYTSISITGTGALAFSNPASTGTLVILKSQGNVTITSSASPAIDGRNLGATAGAGGTAGSGGGGADGQGTSGTAAAASALGTPPTGGTGGTGFNSSGTSGATGGPGGSANSPTLSTTLSAYSRLVPIVIGAGGAGGGCGSNSKDGGAGGRGAGSIIIQCGRALNFTSTVSVAGTAGSNAAGGGNQGPGGGGGGGAGSFFVYYTTLTANTSTITTTGGAGGTGDTGSGGAGTRGGAGAGGGGSATAGSTASNPAGPNGTNGAAGGTGLSFVLPFN